MGALIAVAVLVSAGPLALTVAGAWLVFGAVVHLLPIRSGPAG
ncbi:hypothetical protein A8924_2515 [Saccharopolyspora erythraea NRRL 2338]|uniref:Uncharacterized protein n=2 Tax=Saccharopolyspora erythraea TaxID=1836 RepID=A4FBJ8_SACEN|nr:hypothetical protein [Saccharopolyspora erythraea]EQD83047.1 hypothetical protein N599_27350 [Saccharopolyspora erythraea D]PFG95203.1 hypothetical protein A8924_2515 [Saccharopolyspora erythraea NRRL 2338]CAM01423.1 hypothetical protein SACE_2117 [Saccharopolyspora erythraea NRRL 2338]